MINFFRRYPHYFLLAFHQVPLITRLAFFWLVLIVLGLILGTVSILASGLLVTALIIFPRRKISLIYAIYPLLALLAFLRFGFIDSQPIDVNSLELSAIANRSVSIGGKVATAPDWRGRVLSFRLANLKLSPGGQGVNGSLDVSTTPDIFYTAGETLSATGTVEVYQSSAGQTYYQLRFPRITVISGAVNNPVLAYFNGQLDRFRERLLAILEKTLPEPQAALAAGVVLGLKRQLPPDFALALKRAGLTHVVVASGYNISMAMLLFSALAKPFGRRLSFFTAGVMAIFYGLLCGGGVPVWRAVLMSYFGSFGKMLGREKLGGAALLTSAAIMTAWSPAVVLDLSFQLSFLATFGLIYLVPGLEILWPKKPWWLRGRLVKDALLTSLAAQIATAPVLIGAFGQLSLVAPLTNFLIFMSIPAMMALTALTLFAGLVSPALAGLSALFAWVPLTYFIGVVDFFGNLSWALMRI